MDIAFVKQKSVAFGGGEGYLQGLMQRCLEKGVNVHLLTAKWSGGDDRIQIHPIPMKKYSRKARAVSFAAAVQDYLKKNKFDAVLSLERTVGQDVWRGGEGVHRVWLNMRAKYESPLKTWLVENSSFQKAVLKIEEECIRTTPRLIANSDMVKRDILSVFPNVDPAKISVIYNGVDPARFNPQHRERDRAAVREQLGMRDAEKLLLLAGSGFRRKGVFESLQVMREFPACRLVIMGRDDARPWKKTAAALGVSDRVVFHPPQQDVAAFYRAADTALVPSWYDPFPNVGIEALACGTPVVTTESSGTCDLIREGENGAVVDIPSNLPGYAAAVQTALAVPAGEAVAASAGGMTQAKNTAETMRLLMNVMEVSE